MCDLELSINRAVDGAAGFDELPGLIGADFEAELSRIDQRVEDAAIGDVELHLKWGQKKYAADLAARMGKEVDYLKRPSEDFARGMLTFEDVYGNEVVVEATTSWAYVGPGLRIQLELLGPEYALEFSSLSTGLKIFMSRAVTGSEGEDLVEKQNAEQGLMPVLEDEAGIYGYTDENRHMVEAFRKGEQPSETFADGLAVIEMLMALYKSAEEQRTVTADEDLLDYIPVVARPV